MPNVCTPLSWHHWLTARRRGGARQGKAIECSLFQEMLGEFVWRSTIQVLLTSTLFTLVILSCDTMCTPSVLDGNGS